MKTAKSVFIFLCIAASLIACGSDPVPSENLVGTISTTAHDNNVSFAPHNEPAIKTMTFEYDNGFSITPGQPWEGLTVSLNKNSYDQPVPSMNARAGRHASSTPLDWFNARNHGKKISSMPSWSNIGTLNFAFTGYLIINGDRYLVVIGQEGLLGTNGWWVAGQDPGWTYHSPAFGPDYLLTPDAKWQIMGDSYVNDNFFLTKN